MSKITQYISSIGTDKYMHFLVCEVLAWLIARVLRLCGVDQWAAMAVGFGVAVAVGVSKELFIVIQRGARLNFTSSKPVRFGGSTSYSAYSDSAGQWSLFLYDGGSWNSTFARGRLF